MNNWSNKVSTYEINGQRVTIDESDNPSQEEIVKRVQEAAAKLGTQEQPTEPEQGMLDTVMDNVAEIPEAIASGGFKATSNMAQLFSRGMNAITFDKYSEFTKWANDGLGLGYYEINNDGAVLWSGQDPREVELTEDNSTVLFDTETPTGDLVEGVTQFAVGLALTRGAGLNANTLAGYAGQGAVAENLVFNPYEDRLSNLVQSVPALENPLTEYLSADPEDTEIEARFKMTLEGLGLGAAVDGIFAAARTFRNSRAGKETLPEDEDAIQAYIDEALPDVEVNLNSLEEKILSRQIEIEGQRRDTYKAIDADEELDGPARAQAKAEARKDAIQANREAEAELEGVKPTEEAAEKYGYGVTRTNEEVILDADEVIAEAFVDSPSMTDGIQNIRALLNSRETDSGDTYIASLGRLAQLSTKNLLETTNDLPKIEAQALKDMEALDVAKDAEGNPLPAEEIAQAKRAIHQKVIEARNQYRKARDDYAEVTLALHGRASNSGREVQLMKLFQNFDAPPEQVERTFDELLMNAPDNKTRNTFLVRTINKMVDGSIRTIEAINEMFINSILSGGATHVINTATNGANAMYKPLERLAAAGVRSVTNPKAGAKQAKKALAQYAGLAYNIRESLHLAGSAYARAKPLLDNNVTYENAERTVIGKDIVFPKESFKDWSTFLEANGDKITVLDAFGTLTRATGTRGLTAEDELFKNLNMRGKIYGDSYVDTLYRLRDKGLNPDDLEQFIELKGLGPKEAQKYLEGKKLTDKEIKELARYQAHTTTRQTIEEQQLLSAGEITQKEAQSSYREDSLQYAREATFTQELEAGGQAFQKLVDKSKVFRQVFPFIRTPLNLISESVQRTPLAPILSGRWRKDYDAGGERRAIALTRLSIGMGIAAGMYLEINENGVELADPKDTKLTGAGPSNYVLRQNMQQIGGELYGSYVFDDGTQVQINRVDPVSMTFELIHSVKELQINGNYEEADNVALATGLYLANLMVNETYGTSVKQILRAMQDEDGLKKFMLNRASQIMPWSGLGKSFTRVTDPVQREIVDMADALKVNYPYLSNEVPAKYNVFGEVVDKPSYYTTNIFGEEAETMQEVLSPLMTAKKKEDPVAVEFVNQKVATPKFSRYVVEGRVDLRDEMFTTDMQGNPLYKEGQTAFDELNKILSTGEIEGRTLRQHLELIIQTPEYQDQSTDEIRIELPAGRKKSIVLKGSRHKILTAQINKYKKAAMLQLRRDNERLHRVMVATEKLQKLAETHVGQSYIKDKDSGLNAILEGK
jgi:hypothetical protein